MFHAYSCYGRGIDMVNGAYQMNGRAVVPTVASVLHTLYQNQNPEPTSAEIF